MFKQTNSHGLVSLPFLGLIQYYLEKNDFLLIKNVPTELYSNLSYIILSQARDFKLEALSNLVAKMLKNVVFIKVSHSYKYRRDKRRLHKKR